MTNEKKDQGARPIKRLIQSEAEERVRYPASKGAKQAGQAAEKVERLCDICAHKNDSGDEYCGSCETGRSNWSESGYEVERRLQATIDTLTAQLVQKEAALTDCRIIKDRAEHLREEAEQQLAAVQAKNESLQAHAGHTPKCAVRAGLELRLRPDKNCDCGLAEILSKRDQKGGG